MLVLAGLIVSGVPRSAEVGSGRGDDHAPALVGHHEVDRDEQCPIVHNWADYRGGWTGEVTQQGRQHRYPHTCNSSNIDNQVRKPSVTLSSSDTEPVVKVWAEKLSLFFWWGRPFSYPCLSERPKILSEPKPLFLFLRNGASVAQNENLGPLFSIKVYFQLVGKMASKTDWGRRK